MKQAKLILKPEIFLRNKADLCFIGQDAIEMLPGELWLIARWGAAPTVFNSNNPAVTRPQLMKSFDHGRTWVEAGHLDIGWNVDGICDSGGHSILRLASGRVVFISHRRSAKYGASGSHGMPVISTSDDAGATWSNARVMRDDDDIIYVMNQRLVQMSGGRLILPVSGRDPRTPLETYGEGSHPCQSRCLISDDEGETWRWSRETLREDTERGVQEPAVLEAEPGRLVMLYRSGNGCNMTAFSTDGGDTWSPPERTTQTSACSSLTMLKLPDGRLLTAYNHAVPLFKESYYPRNPLVYATSRDGRIWSEPVLIDDQPGQQLIYPSITLTAEGLLVVYCAHYDAGDGGFNFPSDAWKTGGGKRAMIEYPKERR
jgi:hypothetical protein